MEFFGISPTTEFIVDTLTRLRRANTLPAKRLWLAKIARSHNGRPNGVVTRHDAISHVRLSMTVKGNTYNWRW